MRLLGVGWGLAVLEAAASPIQHRQWRAPLGRQCVCVQCGDGTGATLA